MAQRLLPATRRAWPSCAAAPVDVMQTFPAKKTWANIRGTRQQLQLAERRLELRPGDGDHLLPAVPGPSSRHRRTGWRPGRRGAGGLYDSNHDAAALGLAQRYAGQRVRHQAGLGVESYRLPVGPATTSRWVSYYTAYFRRVVDRFRIRVPNVLIDWCGGRKGATNAGLPSFYPGDDWVDFIGLDCYDWYPAMISQAVWDKEYNQTNMGGPRGLGTWLAYAVGQGKKLSFGEWGVVSGTADGGGDNPFFINQMINFFQANAANIAYEAYFNTNHAPNIHCFADNPNAAAAYAALLGVAT